MTTQVRIGTVGGKKKDRVALIVGDGMVFLDEVLKGAPTDVKSLITGWSRWREDVLSVGSAASPKRPIDNVQWLPPVTPGKLLCVGTNYRDHVAEMGGISEDEIPFQPFPFSFLKPETAITGDDTTVVKPAHGRSLDWEAELAVVIGDGSAAAGPDPLAAVFGYTILNDLSFRDFYPFPHFLGLDAVVSKGFDGAAPIGPWITLAEDVPDPQALPIILEVNGEIMQNSSTAKMIFTVSELIAHYGRVLTLRPGDVIATGTPAGCGNGHRPPRFLSGGDKIEVRIGDLGRLRTTIGDSPKEDLLLKDEVAAAG